MNLCRCRNAGRQYRRYPCKISRRNCRGTSPHPPGAGCLLYLRSRLTSFHLHMRRCALLIFGVLQRMTLPSFVDRVAVHTHLSAKCCISLRPISTLPSIFSGDGLEVMLPDGFRCVFPPPADNVLLANSHLIGNPRRGLIPVHEVPCVFHFSGLPVFVYDEILRCEVIHSRPPSTAVMAASQPSIHTSWPRSRRIHAAQSSVLKLSPP